MPVMVLRYPYTFASPPAMKFPISEPTMIHIKAVTTAPSLPVLSSGAISGRLRMCFCCQNRNVQWAVSDTAQMIITRHVTPRTAGLKRALIFGTSWPLRASVHSSVSGTALRIQRVIKAGRIPMRKI